MDTDFKSEPVVNATVTVIVNCYSHPSFFKETCDSVLAQTSFNQVKFIIYDNGSDLNYRNLIDEYAKINRIEVFREPKNLYGLGFRLNLLPLIHTEYVAFLHDDDVYEPQKIELSLNRLKKDGLDFVISNTSFIDANSRQLGPDVAEFNTEPIQSDEPVASLLFDMFRIGGRMHYSTLVIKTSLAQKISLGDPFYPRIPDAFFWTGLLLRPNIRFGILTQCLSAVRAHSNNDRRYSRARDVEMKEIYLVAYSEAELFKSILRECKESDLRELLQKMHSARHSTESLVEDLILASIALREEEGWVSRPAMAAAAFHLAFQLDCVRSSTQLRHYCGADANEYMIQVYNQHYASNRFYFLKVYPIFIRLVLLIVTNPSVAWNKLLARATVKFGKAKIKSKRLG